MSNESDEKQGSGLRYPFIPLRKAIERARKVWEAAGESSAFYNDVMALWNYSAASSGGMQTIAALKYYGLLNSVGVKETRKFRLTEEARRYFLDERPEKHDEAHKYFALKPRAMDLLWSLWRTKLPSEPIARSTLKIDHHYSETAARELLAIYAENLAFAAIAEPDRLPGDHEPAEPAYQQVTVYDDRRSPSPMVPAHPAAPQASATHVTAYVPQGIREDTCNLPEGIVTLSFPETFSEDSYLDLQAWLDFQKNRLKRWVRQQ